MLADQPTLQPGIYRLPDEPVGPRILIPGFQAATSVRGAFGWFTAGWISRLAPGLANYLNRTDTVPIDLTVSPAIFAAEKAAIDRALVMSSDEATERIANVFQGGWANTSALERHALECLAWMIATGRLRLRIAIPRPESNYHPKIWLFDDGKDQVLARGSGNATGRGVADGVEHLDVDVTWNEFSRGRVLDGVSILNDWSRGRSPGIAQVLDLPEAVEQDIIRTAPHVAPTASDYSAAVSDDGEPAWASDAAESLRQRFSGRQSSTNARLVIPEWLVWEEGDYGHQGEAVRAWETDESPERGTIAMATGAGKTLTALICATRAQDRLADDPFLVVVSAPSSPLVDQWVNEVERFGVTAVAPSRERNADIALTTFFRRLARGGTHVLVVTNNMLCTPAFQNTVAVKAKRTGKPVPTMFIADEAHSLGAEGFINNKPELFERRLALSATPERQYDPDGTEEIFEFFGPPVYEFGLDRAIGFCLSPYNYYVHAATLDEDELDEFVELSGRIGAAMGRGDDDDTVRRLLIARRRIVETAQAKISLLHAVLGARGAKHLTHALIYASAKNPEQFDQIGEMLGSLDIRWAPVTQETTANPKLLNETLSTFEQGGYQVLLAKKVLDEGVDIPSIREAFIVASSTVQREWIQRRGRVLRRSPGKQWALVHDFIALPPAKLATTTGPASARKIIRSELDRAYSFAAHARNAVGGDGVLATLETIRGAYWPQAGDQRVLHHPGDYLVAPATPQGDPW